MTQARERLLPLSDAATLLVSETFLSFQGEGPSAGERAVFLRLAGCNLTCSWCDTPYAWDWIRYDQAAETEVLAPPDAAARVAALAGDFTRLLVLTGGEPLLQQEAVADTLALLRTLRPNLRCEVETNGAITPAARLAASVHRFVVSPKLANADVRTRARIRPAALRAFADKPTAVLKLVVSAPAELSEAAEVASRAGFGPERVWIMPLGTDPDDNLSLAQELADPVLASGFNLTVRMHVLLWGDARGR